MVEMDDLTSNQDSKSKKHAHFNIYQLDAKLAIAFQTDCENFLYEFSQRQNYTFKSFAQLWKEKYFLEIFKCFENILMIQVFIENCFFITKKFLFVSDLCMQTGAIYVLYGLYYKQPIKEWVKIRLTQSDVSKMEEILATHKSMNCLDPIFIYNKMRIEGAFHYCALPKPLGLETRYLRQYDLSSEEMNIRAPRESVLDKFKNLLEENPCLVNFEETDEEYQRLAEKYKEKLFIFPSKVCTDLKKAYSETFNVDLGDEDSCDGQGRLRNVKNKAMSNANAIYRGDRKIVTAADLATPSTSK